MNFDPGAPGRDREGGKGADQEDAQTHPKHQLQGRENKWQHDRSKTVNKHIFNEEMIKEVRIL